MAFCDLHIHSTYSDGSLDVMCIVEKTKKLKQFSITDHDTFKAYRMHTLPSHCIPGIEISTHDKKIGKDVHILAYAPKDMDLLEKFCEPTRQSMEAISYEQVKRLQKIGIPISWKQVKQRAGNSVSVYKQHILSVLIDLKITDTIYGDFYYEHFKNGGFLEIPKEYPETKDAIEAIHQAKGLAILAHPVLSNVGQNLDVFKMYGIDGIEVFHSSTRLKDVYALSSYCEMNNLLQTGGSDFHGMYGNEPEIANFYMEKEICIKNL